MDDPGPNQLLVRVVDLNPLEGSRAPPLSSEELRQLLAALEILVQSSATYGDFSDTYGQPGSDDRQYLSLVAAERGSLSLLLEIVTILYSTGQIITETVDYADKLLSMAASASATMASLVALAVACRERIDPPTNGPPPGLVDEPLKGLSGRDLFALAELTAAIGQQRSLEVKATRQSIYLPGPELIEIFSKWPKGAEDVESFRVILLSKDYDEFEAVRGGRVINIRIRDKKFIDYLEDYRPMIAGAEVIFGSIVTEPIGYKGGLEAAIRDIRSARFLDGAEYVGRTGRVEPKS